MSTRSQIGFYKIKPEQQDLEKFEVLIYRHSDGYPEGVLPDIIPFLQWWIKVRSIYDTEYVSARLLQWLCNQYDGNTTEMYKKLGENDPIINSGFTGILGHGICKQLNWDIEYYYAIYPKGVDIYDVEFDKPCTKWKLIKEINLGKEVNIKLVLKEMEVED